MANQTEQKPKKPAKEKKAEPSDNGKTPEEVSLDKVETLEAVSAAVKRTIEYNGESKEFVQKQLSFIHKTRFFRLLAGTLRLAADQNEGGLLSILDETLSGFSSEGSPGDFIESIMRLVEISPDFLEEFFTIALRVKPEDQQWFFEAIEEMDDEEALEIIDVFIAQNSEPIKDFFTKHLKKLGARVSQSVNLEEVLQSEDTVEE